MSEHRLTSSSREHAEVLRIVEEEAQYGNPVFEDEFPPEVSRTRIDECVRYGWLDQDGDAFYLTERGHAEAATHGR